MTVTSWVVTARDTRLSVGACISPTNFTKPPIGNQLTRQRVPRLSRNLEDRSAEADGEGFHSRAEHAADPVVAELVNRDDDRNHDQERKGVAQNGERMSISRRLSQLSPGLSRHAARRSFSIVRSRDRRSISKTASKLSGAVAAVPALEEIVEHFACHLSNRQKSDPSLQKGRHRDLVRPVQHNWRAAPCGNRRPRDLQARESAAGSGGAKSSLPILARSRRSRPGRGIRSGQESA